MPVTDYKAERKVFSRIGFAVFVMTAVRIALSFVFKSVLGDILNTTVGKSWEWYALYLTATYLVGLPIAVLIILRMPSVKIEKNSIHGQFFIALVICLFLGYTGGVIGGYVNSLIGAIAQRHMKDLMSGMIFGSDIWPCITVVGVIGPVLEETFFRRVLINKLRIYGEWIAVLIPALIFGLSHGNFMQFIYTFPFGLALGYVYVKTGRLIYTIIIHMTMNLISTFFALNFNTVIVIQVYSALMLAVMIAGFILLIVKRKQIHFNKPERELPGWKRAAFINAGMILFFAACAAIFALNTYNALT